MSFRELDEFFDPTLKLPIHGKTYVIQSPDAATGLLVQGLMAVAADARAGRQVNPDELQALVLDDEEERSLHQRLLGATYDEMVADGVRHHVIAFAGQTVLFWVVRDKAFAEAYWNGGGTPKARSSKKPGKRSGKKGRRVSPASSSPQPETPASGTPGETSSTTGP